MNDLDKFSVSANDEWAFSGHKSTNYLSHGYHRYPAKFVPNLVRKLIEEYTVDSDTIVDLFAGCGTTLVESKVHGRKSIGVDINPVARMITEAKITPIDPEYLDSSCEILLKRFNQFDANEIYYGKDLHSRIDYWFRENEKNRIAFIKKKIGLIHDPKLRGFFFCALSNILKPSSKWLQSGTKPQIDPSRNENIADPLVRFGTQLRNMQRQNRDYFDALTKSKCINTSCKIINADARSTGIRKNSVGAIITSPPYVTSYEYADIHQLTGYWFDFIKDLGEFRKQFIGTFYSDKATSQIEAPIAQNIVEQLQEKSRKYSREISNYFTDMVQVTKEMNRILKLGGDACLVIGNTNLVGVDITSAQAFAEILSLNGFQIKNVIKRQVTNKLNPTIRDMKSGRFTTLTSSTKKEVYPEEYILIATKISDQEAKREKQPK